MTFDELLNTVNTLPGHKDLGGHETSITKCTMKGSGDTISIL